MLFSIAMPTAHASYHYTLTQQQADSYIDQCLARMEYTLTGHMPPSALRELRSIIENGLAHATTLGEWTYHGWRYSKDRIDQHIISGILQCVEKISYEYAFSRCHSERIARKISESMRNNVHAKIQKYGYFDAQLLIPFVGYHLENAIDNALNHFDAPYQQSYYPAPQQPTAVYLSEECCVCYESFQDVRRIILRPCGHDICTGCACSWFITDQRKTCPQCRAVIDRLALERDLAH
jgi:hypothetical protein